MPELDTTALVLLALLGFLGGIGITAVGPGGVLPTIGLFALTDLSPAQVAGTAIVTHIATGLLGTAAYLRSGQLRQPETQRMAVILAATALIGVPLGVLVNTVISARAFGWLLSGFVLVVAGMVWWRERADGPRRSRTRPLTHWAPVVGMGVSVASGIVGIGGPMLTVPLLVALGAPMLESLAAAQAQSVVIASAGTIGYLLHGAIDWRLAVLVGVPELLGVLLGWVVARAVPRRALTYTLIATLLAVAPYLAWQS